MSYSNYFLEYLYLSKMSHNIVPYSSTIKEKWWDDIKKNIQPVPHGISLSPSYDGEIREAYTRDDIPLSELLEYYEQDGDTVRIREKIEQYEWDITLPYSYPPSSGSSFDEKSLSFLSMYQKLTDLFKRDIVFTRNEVDYYNYFLKIFGKHFVIGCKVNEFSPSEGGYNSDEAIKFLRNKIYGNGINGNLTIVDAKILRIFMRFDLIGQHLTYDNVLQNKIRNIPIGLFDMDLYEKIGLRRALIRILDGGYGKSDYNLTYALDLKGFSDPSTLSEDLYTSVLLIRPSQRIFDKVVTLNQIIEDIESKYSSSGGRGGNKLAERDTNIVLDYLKGDENKWIYFQSQNLGEFGKFVARGSTFDSDRETLKSFGNFDDIKTGKISSKRAFALRAFGFEDIGIQIKNDKRNRGLIDIATYTSMGLSDLVSRVIDNKATDGDREVLKSMKINEREITKPNTEESIVGPTSPPGQITPDGGGGGKEGMMPVPPNSNTKPPDQIFPEGNKGKEGGVSISEADPTATITISTRNIVGEVPLGEAVCGFSKSRGFLAFVISSSGVVANIVRFTKVLGEADKYAPFSIVIEDDKIYFPISYEKKSMYIAFHRSVDGVSFPLGEDKASCTYDLDKFTDSYNLPKGKVYISVPYTIGTDQAGATSPTDIQFAPLNTNLYNIYVNGELGTPGTVKNKTFNVDQLDAVGFFSDMSLYGDNGGEIAAALRNPSGKCLTGGWIGDSDTGCGFLNKDQADGKFFYTYAQDSEFCGSTKTSFGVCKSGEKTNTCTLDNLSSIKEKGDNPYTCSPTDPTGVTSWIKENLNLVIGLVVGFFILVGLIIVVLVIVKKKKKNNAAAANAAALNQAISA